MSEYQEKRTVVREVPGSRPVVESQYDSSVVHERRGMSGTAVAALIIAVIAAAVVITMLIINNQQRTSDEQLAQERARTATAQQPVQTAPQSQPQPPIIVTVPQQQPAVVPAPPSQPAAAPAPRTSTEVEIDVTSKLLDDSDLHSYPIDVKVSGGTATLSGQVPSSDLKIRAGKLARTVQGVGSVTNNIVVQP
jgi:type II secretory pathway pseudopilin PulG